MRRTLSASDVGDQEQPEINSGAGSSSGVGATNLVAPLLVRPSTSAANRSSRQQAVRSPPRRAFFQFRNRNSSSSFDGGDNNNNDDHNEINNYNRRGDENGGSSDDDDEDDHQYHTNSASTTTNTDYQISLNLLGRPYATQIGCMSWWISLPAVILLGLLVSLAGLAFVTIVTLGHNLWLDIPISVLSLGGTTDSSTTTTHSDHDDSYDIERPWKNWKWLAITATGGFLAGLLSLFPGASPTVETRSPSTSLVHPIVTLQERSAGGSSSCCCIARVLASATALMTGAQLGPEVAVTELAVCFASRLADLCGISGTVRNVRNSRIRSLWVLSATTGAWGAFFYGTGPVIGPMIAQELITTTRPHAVTIDALLQEGRRTRRTRSDHSSSDYMESLFFQVVATTVSVLLVQQMLDWIVGSGSTHLTEDKDYGDYSYDYNFELWHVAAAILIGIACGLVGMFIHFLTLFCSLLRASTVGPSRLGLPRAVHVLLFCTLAGVSNGLLIVACPNAAVDGFAFLRLSMSPSNLTQALSTSELAWMTLTKAVSMSISLGFGLIGGSILPTVVIGACLGFVMSGWIGFLPISLTVPCCLAAIPVSLCPAPMSSTMAVILLVGTSAEQTTPIIIAAMSAWTITGGLGLLRRVSEIGNNSSSSRSSELVRDNAQLDEHEERVALLTEDEILRDVRSSIFGDADTT